MIKIEKAIFRPGWVVYLLPAMLSVLAAFVLGTMRGGPELVPDFDLKDKVGHMLAFGFVQVTHIRAAWFIAEPHKSSKMVWGAAIVATAWGVLLEVVQVFLPYRSADFWDVVADACGAFLAAGMYWARNRSPAV